MKSSLQALDCPSALIRLVPYHEKMLHTKRKHHFKVQCHSSLPHFRGAHILTYMTDSSEFPSRNLKAGRESLSGNALFYSEVCMATIL